MDSLAAGADIDRLAHGRLRPRLRQPSDMRARGFGIVLLAIYLTAVVAVTAQPLSPSGSGKTAPTVAPTSVVRVGDWFDAGRLGAAVRKFETQREIQWGLSSASIERATGIWVIVELALRNGSTRPERMRWDAVRLRDASAVAFQPNDSVSRLVSRARAQAALDAEIGPGMSVVTTLLFDVPLEGTGLALHIDGARADVRVSVR